MQEKQGCKQTNRKQTRQREEEEGNPNPLQQDDITHEICYFLSDLDFSFIRAQRLPFNHLRTVVVNPTKNRRGGGGEESNPPPLRFFCPLLKRSSDDPQLKFLEFFQLLVADTLMKFFFSPKILCIPFHSTFEISTTKILFCYCFNQKNLLTHPR